MTTELLQTPKQLSNSSPVWRWRGSQLSAPAYCTIRREMNDASASMISVDSAVLHAARLLRLGGVFERNHVSFVTLKGPALSSLLYGDFSVRDCVDLDFLVRSRDLERAIQVITQEGYELASPMGRLPFDVFARRCSELTFIGNDDTVIDLHWEIATTDRPFRIPEGRLWSSVSTTSIAGRTVPVLAPECLLVYLSIHGAAHRWYQRKWLKDIERLLEISKDICWDEVLEIASESRASHAVALALHLVQRLYCVELPPSVEEIVARNSIVYTVGDPLVNALRRGDANRPSSAELSYFNARLAETRWAAIVHLAALFKAPTDADVRFVRLPQWLLWLYYPLRALRIVGRGGLFVFQRLATRNATT